MKADRRAAEVERTGRGRRHLGPMIAGLLMATMLAVPAAARGEDPTAAQVPLPDGKCARFKPAMACSGGACLVTVVLQPEAACSIRIDDAFIKAQQATRISEKTIVRVRVLQPNLLRYALKFESRETEVESYVYLEKLWKQIFGFGNLPFTETQPFALSETEREKAEKAFVAAINAWRTRMAAVDRELTAFINGYGAVTLADAEVAAIVQRVADHKLASSEIEKLREIALAAMARAEHFAVYDATLATHASLADRLTSFAVLADAIKVGVEKRITFGAAGRIVAVTVSVTDKASGQERTEAVAIEFFVHSTMPVTFHAGYSVRALEEQSFDTVASSLATAGGADLYAKVRDSKLDGTFSAFMSYRFMDADRLARWCPQLTIGTDFTDIGERLYAGLSWKVGRAFLTAGAVNAETVTGEGPVQDSLGAIGQLTGSRELFTAISTKRKWGGFFGISFAPF